MHVIVYVVHRDSSLNILSILFCLLSCASGWVRACVCVGVEGVGLSRIAQNIVHSLLYVELCVCLGPSLILSVMVLFLSRAALYCSVLQCAGVHASICGVAGTILSSFSRSLSLSLSLSLSVSLSPSLTPSSSDPFNGLMSSMKESLDISRCYLCDI